MMLGLADADDWTVCMDACKSIVPEATFFQDPEFDTCRCNFYPRGLLNSLFRSDKMKLFLRYSGCKDIFSFTRNPEYPVGVLFCK